MGRVQPPQTEGGPGMFHQPREAVREERDSVGFQYCPDWCRRPESSWLEPLGGPHHPDRDSPHGVPLSGPAPTCCGNSGFKNQYNNMHACHYTAYNTSISVILVTVPFVLVLAERHVGSCAPARLNQHPLHWKVKS